MLRRFLVLKLTVVCLTLFAFSILRPARAVAQSTNNDVVMVLPFENTTNKTEYNWVGESFADSLTELINWSGTRVVSGQERALAYQDLRLPLTTIPSLATAIKLALDAHATVVVIGSYNVSPPQGATPAALIGRATVIRVNEGRFMGTVLDNRWAKSVYDFGGALTTLQTMQGRLAYDLLNQSDTALTYSRNQFIQQATTIPQLAFEAYVKGAQTAESDPKRVNYFKNALRIYSDANAGATYPQAAFELGHFYLKQQDWKNAAEYLGRLGKKDPHYAEAAFYAGLAYWKLDEYGRALDALVPLSTVWKFTGIFNNIGAISLAAAREEKKTEQRERLLDQARTHLARAVTSSPDDLMVLFNYGYALFLSGKYAEAADQLRPILVTRPTDGEVYFLFAKSLERAGKSEDAASADNQARRYLQVYAKWQTEWQKSQTTTTVPLRLQVDFSRSNYYDALRDRDHVAVDLTGPGSTHDLLIKAKELYDAGQDDEALLTLRRVLTVEPMSAEAYLLVGQIKQRAGDLDSAISALRTAAYWKTDLIDAHILLGRIFIERGDRSQAMSYAKSAMQIDPNNPEAIALQRLVETGGR